jgi:hypothetical protein
VPRHVAAALLLLGGPLFAQQPPAGPVGGPPQIFIAPSGEPFRAGPGAPYPVAAWFAGADADGDGQLTRVEFLADAQRYFTLLDSDRSGQLEAAEVDAYEAGVLAPLTRRPGTAPERKSEETGGSAPPVGGSASASEPAPPPPMRRTPDMPKGAGLYGLINSPHPVKAADRDMNSRVTADEWARTLGDRYAMLERGMKGTGQGPLRAETLPKTPVQQMQPKAR